MLQKQPKTIILIAVLFITHTLTAQVSNFKLSDFKYRTPGFKALGVSALGNGYINKPAGPTEPAGTHASSFNINPAAYYAWQYSTDKQQLSLSVTNLGFDYSSFNQGNGLSKIKRIKLNSNVDFSLLRFVNKYFGELGFTGSFAPSISKKRTTGTTTSVAKFTNYTIGLKLGGGIGRLEYVSNAQMAMFILEDLKKAGKIKNEVGKETAAAFAHFITQIYNKRIFDFRKRRMYEIEKIDSFLVAAKIVAPNDIKTFNIINDNWAFAIQPPAIDAIYVNAGTPLTTLSDGISDRENLGGMLGQTERYSGRQIYIRILPFIRTNKSEQAGTPTVGGRVTTANFIVGYQDKKPINLHWQFDKYAYIVYQTGSSKIPNNVPKFSSDSLIAGVRLGYYPNSRTVVSGVAQFGASKDFTPHRNHDLLSKTTVALNADYFVNYNSRIGCSLGANFFNKNNTIGKLGGKFDVTFTIGYRVYIF